ncbi:MAG: hypothetical protein R2861_03595 [Desulfobacterales bacterium]
MKILGIESSCDETAAAVVEDGVRVLSSVVASLCGGPSSLWGVVPELCPANTLKTLCRWSQ